MKLEYEFNAEPTKDRDWFQVSVRPKIAGGYTDAEIQTLIAACGQLVQLPDKGWRRLDTNQDESVNDALRAIGVDPMRGNRQRLHVTQLVELVPESNQSGSVWEEVNARVAQISVRPKAMVAENFRTSTRKAFRPPVRQHFGSEMSFKFLPGSHSGQKYVEDFRARKFRTHFCPRKPSGRKSA